MRIVLEIHFPDEADRPGVIVAQTLREVEPVVERMIPLTAGVLYDRLSGVTKAHWNVLPDAPDMVLISLVPNPTAAGGEVVLDCFGESFGPLSVIIIDGVEHPTTFVSPENIRTTNPVATSATPRSWPVRVMNRNSAGIVDPADPDASNTLNWVFE